MNLPYLKQGVSAFVLAFFCIGSLSLSAQNGQFDVRFVVKNYNCAASKVTFILQVKASSSSNTFLMGDANYRFDYDPRIIANPIISSQENFSGLSPSSDNNYGAQSLTGSTAGATKGTVSLNTYYGQGGIGGKTVPTTWTNVSCIQFDLLNTVACLNLTWHTNKDFPITGMDEVILTKDANGNPTGVYRLDSVPASGVFQNYNLCGNLACSSMIANDDINNTKKGTPVSGNVLTNDVSTIGTPTLTTTPLTPPANGTITFNSNGTYTYTPNPNFLGKDVIKYKVCNPANDCDSANLVISVLDTVAAPGKLFNPIANNDSYTTPVNNPIKGNAKGNDVSFNGDTLVYKTTPLVAPKNGIVVLNTDGTFNYTPNNGFAGIDSIRYKVVEKKNPALCDSAWIIIKVIPSTTGSTVADNPPVAEDDFFNTLLNTAIVNGSVKVNDSDPDSLQTLIYTTTPVSAPTHGSVTLNSNGTFTYTPATGYIGSDQFVYKVCDNYPTPLCAQATAYISILPEPNYKPIVTVVPTTVPGDSLSKKCFAIQDTNATQQHTVTTCTPPAHGTLGAVTVDNTTTPHQVCVTYTPTLYYNGQDTVCIIVCDNGNPVKCDTAKIPYTVTPVNHPPVFTLTPITTKGDTSVKVCTTVTNPDNKNKTYTATTCPGYPKNGTATPVVVGNQLCITYTPTLLYAGPDSVCVTVCDSVNACTTVKVPVTVTPVNHKPVVPDTATTTPYNTPVTLCLPVKDPDSLNTNTVSLCNTPKNGTAVPTTNNTTLPRQVCITYTPSPTFSSGKDTVCITTCDNGTPQLCATTKIVVTVGLQPKPPVALNDFNNTLVNTSVSGTVIDNDSDPNNYPLTVTTVPLKNSKNGSITLTSAGGYTYTPSSNFTGKDTAQYKICNNLTPPLCDSAFIYITVSPSQGSSTNPLKPVVNPDVAQTPKNTPVNIPVKANDFSPQGGVLGAPTIIGTPVSGTVTVNTDGTVKFTPTPNFVGKGTFNYAVCDNKTPQQCDTTSVTVIVLDSIPTAKNSPPVAVDDANQTAKNTTVTGTVATNDFDLNVGQILTFTPLTSPPNGVVTLLSNGTYTYTPKNNYTGPDNFKYQVCDNGSPSLCDTATVHITVYDNPCISLTLKVLMEGPLDSVSKKMRTVLNQRGLLPGQTPIGTFAVKTPAGQPYNKAPWNYAGTETVTTYDTAVVDWVLVSLRTPDSAATNIVLKTAGLLYNDGTIKFTTPCFSMPAGNYYVVVEHRNHLGVMSPTTLPIVNNTINFDFTVADAFIITNPPSFGQKLIAGKFVMYAGDGKKDNSTDNFDINFNDSQLWKTESGIFDQYRAGDFNLDADVNFADQVLWKRNSGKYSKVPH